MSDYQARTSKLIKDDGTVVNSSDALSAKYPFTGSTNQTVNFAQRVRGLVITNDVLTDLTFTIGADTYTVKGGEVFESEFDPFDSIVIVAQGNYRGYVKG